MGAGYPLWFGEELDRNLSALDQAGLQLYLAYLPLKLNAEDPALDPRLPEVFAKLEGRPTTISVLLRGFPPGDPRGMKPAVKLLRKLGDLAADSNLRISIYHHLNNWTESLLFALQVVEKVDHPRVGFNFNLCHWLKVDGDTDYRPVLRKHADKLFAVLINGAQRDADTGPRELVSWGKKMASYHAPPQNPHGPRELVSWGKKMASYHAPPQNPHGPRELVLVGEEDGQLPRTTPKPPRPPRARLVGEEDGQLPRSIQS